MSTASCSEGGGPNPEPDPSPLTPRPSSQTHRGDDSELLIEVRVGGSLLGPVAGRGGLSLVGMLVAEALPGLGIMV